jgi:protein gp37
MGEQTAISWSDATWNPWHGCIKVSLGCKNCYMYRDKERFGQDPSVVTRSKTKFTEPLKWNGSKLIFTCSWSDWFIGEADAWRGDAWDVIKRTPQHTYQILTKRPERILDHLPRDWGKGYPNVWLGVSVESKKYLRRLDDLMLVPARIRFASFEPLLEDLGDLSRWLPHYPNGRCYHAHLHWGIIGGESGPDYRPMKDEWAASIVEQFSHLRLPVWFKQHAGIRPGLNPVLTGREWKQFPEAANA